MIWRIKDYTYAYREKQAVIFINDRRGGYNPVIDLVSPSPAASQPHHNANISSDMSLKSNPQFKFHQHFSAQIIPYQTLIFVLNL